MSDDLTKEQREELEKLQKDWQKMFEHIDEIIGLAKQVNKDAVELIYDASIIEEAVRSTQKLDYLLEQAKEISQNKNQTELKL